MRLRQNYNRNSVQLVQQEYLEISPCDNHNLTTNRNKSNIVIASIILIQRSWREYLNCKKARSDELRRRFLDSDLISSAANEISDCCGNVWSMTEQSFTEMPGDKILVDEGTYGKSTNNTNMNIENENNSGQNYISNSSDIQDISETSKFLHNLTVNKRGIESDPDSVVSDYSEINEPIREHLASVQIIRQEDLDLGNAFPCSLKRGVATATLSREPDEDEESYERRVRKTNLLSLAQEFAALKQVNAEALPFDLHEERFLNHHTSSLRDDDDTISDDSDNVDTPMSEVPPSLLSNVSSNNIPRDVAGVPDVVPSGQCNATNKISSPGESLNNTRSSISPARDGVRFRSPARVGSGKNEDVGGAGEAEFDVYTMESTLPAVDWQKLEEQLQRSAEDEQSKWSRAGDRDEIRRKLAMCADEDFSADNDEEFSSLHRRPNLQTRLQAGMNLQVCYVNDAAVEDDDDVTTDKTCQLNSQPDVVPESGVKKVVAGGVEVREGVEGEEDFFIRQAYLQEEAKLALAQVRPMAHMQLQLEKQVKKKSPIAEIIGMPNFTCEKLRQLNRQILTRMNLAQLQVVVNDLHAQIEVLNSDLMQSLVDRDELHMAQDSMLVDIEDLTGRAKEYADRINKRALKKCAGK